VDDEISKASISPAKDVKRSSSKESTSKENVSKENKQNYVPYNGKDYNSFKQDKYVLLGGLGPNIGSEEWEKSKKKKDDISNFAKNVEMLNKEKLAKLPKKAPPKRKLPPKGSSNREKAIEFAKQIQKPTVKPKAKPTSRPKNEDDLNAVDDVEDDKYNELATRSEEYKKKIEEIKKQMNIK
jgi:transcription initiation factor IIF auxiliary subunit